MFRNIIIALLFNVIIAVSLISGEKHRDYVPDEKTALRIAEAVLIANYGDEFVKARTPLRVDDNTNKEVWTIHMYNQNTFGGVSYIVLIDRNSGCILGISEMKEK